MVARTMASKMVSPERPIATSSSTARALLYSPHRVAESSSIPTTPPASVRRAASPAKSARSNGTPWASLAATFEANGFEASGLRGARSENEAAAMVELALDEVTRELRRSRETLAELMQETNSREASAAGRDRAEALEARASRSAHEVARRARIEARDAVDALARVRLEFARERTEFERERKTLERQCSVAEVAERAALLSVQDLTRRLEHETRRVADARRRAKEEFTRIVARPPEASRDVDMRMLEALVGAGLNQVESRHSQLYTGETLAPERVARLKSFVARVADLVARNTGHELDSVLSRSGDGSLPAAAAPEVLARILPQIECWAKFHADTRTALGVGKGVSDAELIRRMGALRVTRDRGSAAAHFADLFGVEPTETAVNAVFARTSEWRLVRSRLLAAVGVDIDAATTEDDLDVEWPAARLCEVVERALASSSQRAR